MDIQHQPRHSDGLSAPDELYFGQIATGIGVAHQQSRLHLEESQAFTAVQGSGPAHQLIWDGLGARGGEVNRLSLADGAEMLFLENALGSFALLSVEGDEVEAPLDLQEGSQSPPSLTAIVAVLHYLHLSSSDRIEGVQIEDRGLPHVVSGDYLLRPVLRQSHTDFLSSGLHTHERCGLPDLALGGSHLQCTPGVRHAESVGGQGLPRDHSAHLHAYTAC
mmetsp:Transcript_50581/g.110730  ORF Transcript_50581/g.110730 Transcript_50581/m.110730 type:complete len:220 (-) Transcript_50581:3-662(-)